MELDKRIVEGKKPLTCFDIKEAKQFIGKECYLSNSFSDYADLNNVTAKRILDDVSNTPIPYSSNPVGIYCYCLPCEWVKEPEKKYRPYTLDEFINKFSLGDEIILRQKENGKIFHKIFMEFEENVNDVCIGSILYSFQMLFVNYELYTSEGWKPFGVEE